MKEYTVQINALVMVKIDYYIETQYHRWLFIEINNKTKKEHKTNK